MVVLMLRPIPSILLNQMGVLHIPTNINAFQAVEYNDVELNKIHLQDTNVLKVTADNQEIMLKSILFIDCRLSSPQFDYSQLMSQAETLGTSLRITINGLEYNILTVDAIPNVPSGIHHYELGLV